MLKTTAKRSKCPQNGTKTVEETRRSAVLHAYEKAIRKATILEIIDWIEGGNTLAENRRNWRRSAIADELRKML